MSANQFLAPEAVKGSARGATARPGRSAAGTKPGAGGGNTSARTSSRTGGPARSGKGQADAARTQVTPAVSLRTRLMPAAPTSARGDRAHTGTAASGAARAGRERTGTAASAAARAGRTRPGTGAPSSDRRMPSGMLVLILGLLVATGVVGGWGLGRGADLVRSTWPAPQPPLAADKVAPPAPVDLSGPAQACPATALGLAVATNVVSIDPGQYVTFDATVTNIGRRPCLVDAGDASRQIEILDAAGAVVWTTAHCGGAARELLLGPGDADQRAIRWNGRVSAPGACGAGQPVLGPGEYTVRIAIAGQPDAVSDAVPLTVVAPPPPPAQDGQEAPAEEHLPDGEALDEVKPDPPVTGDDPPAEAPAEEPAG